VSTRVALTTGFVARFHLSEIVGGACQRSYHLREDQRVAQAAIGGAPLVVEQRLLGEAEA
jgi:hypothetical protein